MRASTYEVIKRAVSRGYIVRIDTIKKIDDSLTAEDWEIIGRQLELDGVGFLDDDLLVPKPA